MKTINVVEVEDGEILSLMAFPLTKKGKKEALKLYVKACHENGHFPDDEEDMESEVMADGFDMASAYEGGWGGHLYVSDNTK